MSTASSATASGAIPCILSYAHRDRTRTLVKSAFPRRRARVVAARSVDDCVAALKSQLVDAVVVDLGTADESTWRVASLAREYPSLPFFGVVGLRVSEGSVLAASAGYDFADVFVDGVDDSVARGLVISECFSTRFARALEEPPPGLSLSTPLQLAAWRYIVGNAGRPIRTIALASELRVTREHLSRMFAADGAPNLKRVIDLVRLLVAAELAKNPGLDLRDVSRVLSFASPSHLSATAQRIAGTKPTSLARLRAIDLVNRFAKGHARSRG